MNADIVVAVIGILPSLLAGLALLILVLVYRKPISEYVIPNLSGLKLLGVEFTLMKQSLDSAGSNIAAKMSEEDKWSALKRARRVFPVLKGARLLWVDDDHPRNKQLRNILSSLKVVVDQARGTEEAVKLLRRHEYDVVVSDIKRGQNDRAGIEMVNRMWSENIYRWTIFYVKIQEPGVPDHAFNITNRPDHLLHYVMDVLERERWE